MSSSSPDIPICWREALSCPLLWREVFSQSLRSTVTRDTISIPTVARRIISILTVTRGTISIPTVARGTISIPTIGEALCQSLQLARGTFRVPTVDKRHFNPYCRRETPQSLLLAGPHSMLATVFHPSCWRDPFLIRIVRETLS